MIRVLGLGDNVVDKYTTLGLMFPGGQGMNIPINAKILENSDITSNWDPALEVFGAFIGVIGTDPAGDHIKKTMDVMGVERTYCRTMEGESGQAFIELIDGDRHFLGSNKGGVHSKYPLRLTDDDLLYIKTFDLVHTSNNSFFDPEMERLATAGIPVSYDFSVTYDQERLLHICPHIQFGFFSCSDLTLQETEDLLKKAYQLGCANGVATRGSDGPVYYGGQEYVYGTVDAIEPLDTLGAGDAFATGFLMRVMQEVKVAGWNDLAKGRELPSDLIAQAMKVGAELSLLACKQYGAFGHGVPIA